MKIDKTVWHETGYVAAGMLFCSLLEQAVFLVIGRWTSGVLFANLLIGLTQIGNFFLMALTVQKAVAEEDLAKRKRILQLSGFGRMLLLFAVLALGLSLPDVFAFWALLPPLLFNRLTLMVRGFTLRAPAGETAESRNAASSEKEAPRDEP